MCVCVYIYIFVTPVNFLDYGIFLPSWTTNLNDSLGVDNINIRQLIVTIKNIISCSESII